MLHNLCGRLAPLSYLLASLAHATFCPRQQMESRMSSRPSLQPVCSFHSYRSTWYARGELPAYPHASSLHEVAMPLPYADRTLTGTNAAATSARLLSAASLWHLHEHLHHARTTCKVTPRVGTRAAHEAQVQPNDTSAFTWRPPWSRADLFDYSPVWPRQGTT